MRINFLKKAIMLIMASFFFTSCEKDTGRLGFKQIIGEENEVNSFSIPVVSYTANIDSILVALDYASQVSLNLGYTGNRLLGQNSDNYFGTAKAGFVGQLMPRTLNTDFGESPKIDSVTLDMRIAGSYGDTTAPMSFKVHLLGQQLSKENAFYSSYTPKDSILLAEVNGLMVRPNTNTTDGGAAAPPSLHINLDTNFFRDAFLAIGNGSATQFSGLNEFINYFKGIHIECTSGKNILYLSPLSSFSRMRIYFHNSTDTSSLEYNFSPDRSIVPIHFSTFEQDYSMAAFNLQSQDSINGENQTFIQSMGGVVTLLKFQFPNLDSLKEEGIIVNRAHLILHQQTGTGLSYAPINQLEARNYNNGALGSRLIDFTATENTNGLVEYGTLRNNKYTFNLTRYIFELTNGSENKAIAISPRIFASQANKVILSGGAISGAEVKVYYSKP